MLYQHTRNEQERAAGMQQANEQKTMDARLAEVVSDVQIPLDNLAYTVEAYLLANGPRLDTETRLLLAGVRDCAGRVAGSVREMAGERQCRPKPRARRLEVPMVDRL
jgi:hypothetical protein